jgi:uncharacterized protein (TIGR03067 family)
MIATIACLLAAAPVLAADPPADVRKGPAELQGAWRLVSVAAEAGSVNLPDPRPALVIKGDRVLYGGEEIARVSTDSASDPKLIDLRFPGPGRVYEGVYAVEKDSLKVCLNGRTEGVKERPDSFSTKGHPARRLLSFERIKPDDVGAGSGFVGLALRFDQWRKEVIVDQALDGSPAQKAGLRRGDVLREVGGAGVTDLRSAVEAVRRAKPGSELALRVVRGGQEREVKVKVGLLPFAVLAGLE